MCKGRRPAVFARDAREGVFRTPACLGRRFWLAEGASQKPLDGLRTRGSQCPGDSLGRAGHMEHEHGAFKVNREMRPWRGREWRRKARPAAQSGLSPCCNAKNSAAVNLVSLPYLLIK